MCYDGDGSDPFFETTHTAKKAHSCIECFAPIPPGTKYVRATGLQDGVWWMERLHVECRQLWERVHKNLCHGEGLIQYGGLAEELANFNEDVDFSGMPRLQVLLKGYKRRFEQIRDHYTRQ